MSRKEAERASESEGDDAHNKRRFRVGRRSKRGRTQPLACSGQRQSSSVSLDREQYWHELAHGIRNYARLRRLASEQLSELARTLHATAAAAPQSMKTELHSLATSQLQCADHESQYADDLEKSAAPPAEAVATSLNSKSSHDSHSFSLLVQGKKYTALADICAAITSANATCAESQADVLRWRATSSCDQLKRAAGSIADDSATKAAALAKSLPSSQPSLSPAQAEQVSSSTMQEGTFRTDLEGSDSVKVVQSELDARGGDENSVPEDDHDDDGTEADHIAKEISEEAIARATNCSISTRDI